MTISGGTIAAGTTILSFGTFNGTSGTVNLSSAQTFANPTTVGAKGFIQIVDPNYPPATVKGIVYLDGTYYVMTPGGAIQGSAINNPFSWSSLNVIQCQAEPDAGIALFRQLNLICAFGDYSVEFFYDAGNPVGSPLLPYSSSLLEMGCASANSIAQAANTLYFMGKGKQKGRSIFSLVGTAPKLISTPFVDRILNADSLSDVKSYYIKISGHSFYILTLVNSKITLVCDITTNTWSKWTQQSLRTRIAPEALTWLDGIATLTLTGHSASPGDYITIASALPSGWNGNYIINVIDANTMTFELANNPGVYVSSGLVSYYTETYFNMASYSKAGNLDLVQDSTTGTVYALDIGTYQDNSLPIKYFIRTTKVDGGSNKEKYFSKFELIGDKNPGTAYVRYSNDDYQTWSNFRSMNLNSQRTQLYRTGRGRRRAYEIINYDNGPVRLEAMEITITEGVR